MVSHYQPDEDTLHRLGAQRDTLSEVLQRALDGFEHADNVNTAECREVLNLLAALDCDNETMAAVLWFYVALGDESVWRKMEGQLPTALIRLVEGQLAAEKVWELHAEKEAGSEGLRRLLLAIIHDLRVVFALLSRQLVRMRAIHELAPERAQSLARLTADIHAPLANRLGIWQLKWELEDLAFRQLHGDTYKRIAKLLDERRIDREQFISDCIHQLEKSLSETGIHADVAGRPKHIYSIWRKMQRKHLDFEELYDIRAIRIIVKDLSDCYAALGVVHSLWPHLPREFDDYIARPKPNGYQSLHTVVVAPEGRTLEVQIRTRDMHRAGELGVAAHWRYKEGGARDTAFEERIAWMRQLLDARTDNDKELFADLQDELIEDRVYLLTPNGDVLDLPYGASVLDFAYYVHTQVGHRCRGAKVNGRIVPLTFKPRSGDRVQVITGTKAEPSRDWLLPQNGCLNTPRAKDKVRAWFRKQQREANLASGQQMLEREWRRLSTRGVALEKLPACVGLQTLEELMEALALGEVTPGQLERAVNPQIPERQPLPEVAPETSRHADTLKVEGIDNLLTSVAACCQPVPGDSVCGFITRGRGVSVHRADCSGLARLREQFPDRVIDVQWGAGDTKTYQVDIGIDGENQPRLRRDVMAVIAGTNTPIVASSSRIDARQAQLHMRFSVRVADLEQLSDLLTRLSSIPHVMNVYRLTS